MNKKINKSSKVTSTVLTTEDIALEAISMRAQGYSYKDIASSLNVNISKVYKAVYNYNRKTNVPARSYAKSTKSENKKNVKNVSTSNINSISNVNLKTNTNNTIYDNMSLWQATKMYMSFAWSYMMNMFK